jgi:hypothetical protein
MLASRNQDSQRSQVLASSFICFALPQVKMNGLEDSFSGIQDGHRMQARSLFFHWCEFVDLPRPATG